MIDQKQLDDNFKRYDYRGVAIYKIHNSGWCAYEEKSKDIAIIEKTLKSVKIQIDKLVGANRI